MVEFNKITLNKKYHLNSGNNLVRNTGLLASPNCTQTVSNHHMELRSRTVLAQDHFAYFYCLIILVSHSKLKADDTNFPP